LLNKEEKPEPPLKCLEGVETPIADSLLGVAANLWNITLDEIRNETDYKASNIPCMTPTKFIAYLKENE